MGIDIGALFGDAKKAAETGMNDILKTGGNAALGYLEGQAVATLEADKAQHAAEFNKSVTEIMNRPTVPGSFGAYFSNAMQGPVMKQYGMYIIAGVVVVGLGALYLFNKGK